MNGSRTTFLVLAALIWTTAACGRGPSAESAQATSQNEGTQVVVLSVTAEGFMPKEWRVEAGRPVKLVVTRLVENTCATAIVIKDYGISKPLPMNQAVEVDFTPTKTGEVRYACAEDMISGVILVG